MYTHCTVACFSPYYLVQLHYSIKKANKLRFISQRWDYEESVAARQQIAGVAGNGDFDLFSFDSTFTAEMIPACRLELGGVGFCGIWRHMFWSTSRGIQKGKGEWPGQRFQKYSPRSTAQIRCVFLQQCLRVRSQFQQLWPLPWVSIQFSQSVFTWRYQMKSYHGVSIYTDYSRKAKPKKNSPRHQDYGGTTVNENDMLLPEEVWNSAVT